MCVGNFQDETTMGLLPDTSNCGLLMRRECRSGGKNVPGIPGACATRKFKYLVRGSWDIIYNVSHKSHVLPWLAVSFSDLYAVFAMSK